MNSVAAALGVPSCPELLRPYDGGRMIDGVGDPTSTSTSASSPPSARPGGRFACLVPSAPKPAPSPSASAVICPTRPEAWMSRYIGVVGAGVMGRGVAQCAAAAGFSVLLLDSDAAARAAALPAIRAALRMTLLPPGRSRA